MSRYESHNLQDQALPFIYKESSVRPTNRMFGSSNWHENIEILYVVDGEGAVSNNGHIIPVSKGSVVVINSNHLHTLAAGSSRLWHRYLIVDRSFCLANGFDSNAISFEMQVSTERVRVLMERLEEAYRQPEGTPYRVLQIRTIVLELMLYLCREHGTLNTHVERPERSIAHIKQAIDYIRASFDKSFSLDDVAEFVGVNKCYLSREFHRYTGYPFVAYVNRTRCKMAQQMLADERLSIFEVGARCGFENRSYFAKCFQRYIGMLPNEYRAEILGQRARG